MASLLKSALVAAALAALFASPASASAPQDHLTKSVRALPVVDQDLRRPVRYARTRTTMNDAWDGESEVVRPRRATRRAHAPRAHRGQVRQHRHAAVRQARFVDGEQVAPRRAQRHAAHVPAGGGATGVASYYWQGQRVASGGWFNPDGLTAAHRTLPFGTRVRVTHMGNGRSVDVTINDRGPFIGGRIIDLSRGAARVIGMTGQGVANVRMEVLGR